MRISDWSSDVCSSDLYDRADPALEPRHVRRHGTKSAHDWRPQDDRRVAPEAGKRVGSGPPLRACIRALSEYGLHHAGRSSGRSEEHTSELQSLMRISYAVFCLKKKKYYNQYILI